MRSRKGQHASTMMWMHWKEGNRMYYHTVHQHLRLGESSRQCLRVGGKHNSWHATLVCVVYRSTRSSIVRDFSNGCKCLEPFSRKWNLIRTSSMRNGRTITAFSHWKMRREWYHMLFLNTNSLAIFDPNRNPSVWQLCFLGRMHLFPRMDVVDVV